MRVRAAIANLASLSRGAAPWPVRGQRKRPRKRFLTAAAISALLLAAPRGADAAGLKVLHSFTGGKDGLIPSGVTPDDAGNLYGTTYAGGRKGLYSQGTVFSLSPDGTYGELYDFKSRPRDGQDPASGVARDKAGNLYGTTPYGGAGYDVCYQIGCGTIFKVAPDGTETVLHRFKFDDGAFDGADGNNSPILGRDGSLYGTTTHGGSQNCYDGCGVVYKLTSKGKLRLLHSFSGNDGYFPDGPLVADQNGNLYGVTTSGGGNEACNGTSCGTIFELTADGTFRVLHAFQESDGAVPWGPLVRDADGNLFGVTVGGGDNSCDPDRDGCGVVFKLAPDGTLTVLHEFTGGSDGGFPNDGLVTDGSGNLYGMTVSGGIQDCEDGGIPGCGVVFKIGLDGTETVLYSFDSNDGGFDPGEGPLLLDRRGNLYGTTWEGGAYGYGTIFKIRM